MNVQPGMSLPDIGLVTPPTVEQVELCRTYVQRHQFADEAELLAMLGVDQ